MSNNKKTKSNWIIVLCVLSVVIISVVWLCSSVKDFDGLFVGGENLAILNDLNENWTLDENYQIDEIDINGMYAEILSKKSETSPKVILQLHGGAYMRDLNFRPNLYKRMAEQYAKISGYSVLTIDYRVAPENPYPAALEDAVDAYNYLLTHGYTGNDIIVVGDSAGGGLALALTMYLRDNSIELPCGLVTMSAWTKLYYKRITVKYVGNNDPKDPYISPYYGDYDSFPKMLMQVGSKDIKDDTLHVAEQARDAGVPVAQTTYQGKGHVFQALYPVVSQTVEAWAEVEEFLKTL